jgi:HSP20 family protein
VLHQILNYDPYRELTDFSRRLVADFEPRLQRAHVPVDIRDEGDSFVLEADLPGFTPADVEIVAAPELLTIKGKRGAKAENGKADGAKAENGPKSLRRERNDFAFERRFELPRGIDLDGVVAKLDAGVLTVRLPKRATDRPRTVTVKATTDA